MVRDQLWYEMLMAFKYNKACAIYTDGRRRWKRRVDVAMVALPFVGIVGDLITKQFFPESNWELTFWGSVFTAITGLVKQIVPVTCQPEKELFELDQIGVYYGKQFVKLLKLWRERERGDIDAKQVSDQLLLIMNENVQYEMDMNRMMQKPLKDKNLESEVYDYMHIACFDEGPKAEQTDKQNEEQ